MKRENRKAWPKLVRDEWEFPKIPDDYGPDDLKLKLQSCDCITTADSQKLDADPIGGENCLLDEYTHCGLTGLTDAQISADEHPIVYLRAFSDVSNPPNIWVYDGLGGWCFTKTDQIACEDAEGGRVLGLEDWRPLAYVGSTAPCSQKLCNQRNETGPGLQLSDCSWVVTPDILFPPAEGSTEEGLIKSPFGCSWDAVNRNDDDWFDFTPTGGLSGRAISIEVEENTGASRTGYIDVYNRIETQILQANTLVGTIEIEQASGLIPVPGSCPAGLEPFYTVVPGLGILNALIGGVCGTPTAPSGLEAPWLGVVDSVGVCLWDASAYVDPAGNTFMGSVLGPPQLAVISFVAGSYWQLAIGVSLSGGFRSWTGRKYDGLTPVGTYVEINGCSPASLEVI